MSVRKKRRMSKKVRLTNKHIKRKMDLIMKIWIIVNKVKLTNNRKKEQRKKRRREALS